MSSVTDSQKARFEQQVREGDVHYPLFFAHVFTSKRFTYVVAALVLIGLITGIHWLFLPVGLVVWGAFYRGWFKVKMAKLIKEAARLEAEIAHRESEGR